MKERGNIEIRKAENNQYTVEVQLSNRTLWLTAHQIANLFEVFISKVTTNITSIYKNEILWEDETKTIHKYTNHAGIECYTELYNLDILLALTYRIKSPKAKALREWIKTSLAQEFKRPKIKIVINPFSTPLRKTIVN